MAFQYVTKAGDVADWIAWKQYGTRSGATEALLDTNPGLADAGTTLPAGLTITLPDLPAAPARATIRIWG
ncbi:tail protein X [Azospirillum doebereinerae]|uniref:Phage tail protein n=1 Tax=Azospirillum doebereinerae TaxID=92933 RepID=A0A3S0X1E3_9PROT|nr:tail protein X [Azospirillum doebereinerae]MCG5240432.1 tail protein X [Azospirillum doebereinerae]RUQ74922.1 phage tail protein [Azospirillum doebereinerae]